MKRVIVFILIIILFILGINVGQRIGRSQTYSSDISNKVQNIIVEEQDSNEEEKVYDIEGEYEPNYDEIEPGYVGTAFRFVFKDGKVKYYTDGEFEGTYTIENDKIIIVFTICYNPGTGEPEEPEYLKGGAQNTIDDNILQNEEGLNFYKKIEN